MISKNDKLCFIDILFIFVILIKDAGNFGIFYLNLFQIVIILIGFYFFLLYAQKHSKVKIVKSFVFLILYITIITLTNYFDIESIKSLIYFIIQLFVIYVYIQNQVPNMNKIYKIIYISSVIISIYGVIQEFAYILNIPAIYDLSLYGFMRNGGYTTPYGLMRVMSFYAEPSALVTILPFGFIVGMLGYDRKYAYVSTCKTFFILMCIILSQSSVVYLSTIVVFLWYLIQFRNNYIKKIKIVAVIIVVFTLLGIYFREAIISIFDKFVTIGNFYASNNTELSSFALWSNFRIAVEKMKDGFWFGTGMDSHRLYYFDYIDTLYGNVLLYLNYNDAASLFIRIFSEFGIVGLSIIILLFIRKLYGALKNNNFDLSLIIIVFIMSALRNGSYTDIVNMMSFVIIFLLSKEKKISFWKKDIHQTDTLKDE